MKTSGTLFFSEILKLFDMLPKLLQMQIAAENTLQDKIIVQVFTEQSSKKLFILINNGEK